MKKLKFPPVEAGEWIRPPKSGVFYMQCCDCNLIHKMKFKHDTKGRIIFAAWRHNG